MALVMIISLHFWTDFVRVSEPWASIWTFKNLSVKIWKIDFLDGRPISYIPFGWSNPSLEPYPPASMTHATLPFFIKSKPAWCIFWYSSAFSCLRSSTVEWVNSGSILSISFSCFSFDGLFAPKIKSLYKLLITFGSKEETSSKKLTCWSTVNLSKSLKTWPWPASLYMSNYFCLRS